jgi:hypothetical protein
MGNRQLLTPLSLSLNCNEILVKESEGFDPNSSPLLRPCVEMFAEGFSRASPAKWLLNLSIWRSIVAEN